MPSKTSPPLSEDELDDILYFSRVGELREFQTAIETCAKRTHAPPHDILLAAVDTSSGNGALHMASANGHTELLTYALSLLPPHPATATILGRQNAAGNTPLHWAALNGHVEAVKALVLAGADPSVANRAGQDALFEAEVGGKEEVVEWLLAEGKGVDAGLVGGSGGGAVEEGGGMDGLGEEVEGGKGGKGGKGGEGTG